ncbi:MAG: PEP/pyruvate-binding domain-containing protein [Chitinispirillaceae bacterium]|nr:PEP/pyruvate-binding domain-containing protein [Chitinispirillaceae bacterium]
MSKVYTSPSSGLTGLDSVLNGIRPGDNIVWQVDSIADYSPFVIPFCTTAIREGRKLVYFRFADHQSVLPEGTKAEVVTLHPENGFEIFIDEVFDVIEKSSTGACYVFDCLSELAADWYSDRMLGNFFMLACPYLYDFETIAYFALLKNQHPPHALNAIHGTAQVVIDVYRKENALYIHPQKVYKRHSGTMYMLHRFGDDGQFVPVKHSALTSEILGTVPHPGLDINAHLVDMWARSFSRAVEISEEGRDTARTTEAGKLFQKLLRMAVSRDQRLIALAEKYFDLSSVIEIGKRMIGTGLIGGKSVGMLLGRAMLRKKSPERWAERLSAHDSFYIASDVFYTYLIRNGCWWARRRLKTRDANAAFDSAQEARQRLLSGTFPDDILAQFASMLNYFGQSPIIVRSSSLLEDAYGNAFSGKYESVFCANQGTPQERLENFMAAVRTVYASTMNHDALSYRGHWGLLDRDEQMALLVQRVSGCSCNRLFFPHVSGVGFSFNPYVWSPEIDPRSGVLRLVFGLGTRAVARMDDDYTRVVSLSAPLRQPTHAAEDPQRYCQRKADVLDLQENRLASMEFREVIAAAGSDVPLAMVASRDEEAAENAEKLSLPDSFTWTLTFEQLLSATTFVDDMREMLSTLEAAYRHPVDIEFTANFVEGHDLRIDLLQCRPFQVRTSKALPAGIGEIQRSSVILRTSGPVIGSSFSAPLDRIIYIAPSAYSGLPEQQRYMVARLIGKLTHLDDTPPSFSIMLIGPGRWGTTTPSLGVPVTFSEINTVKVLCELAVMHEGLVPDVSLGTHFFNDLVEMDMLYCAVHPEREGNVFIASFFENGENLLSHLVPGAAAFEKVIRVIDPAEQKLFLHAEPLGQKGVLFIRTDEKPTRGDGT